MIKFSFQGFDPININLSYYDIIAECNYYSIDELDDNTQKYLKNMDIMLQFKREHKIMQDCLSYVQSFEKNFEQIDKYRQLVNDNLSMIKFAGNLGKNLFYYDNIRVS